MRVTDVQAKLAKINMENGTIAARR